MKITKGKEHVIIQDDLGHTLLFDNEQIPELMDELSNNASIFTGIVLSEFVSMAMSSSAIFIDAYGNLWVIESLSIDNNVSNTSCSAGRCIVSCVLYKKETGKKYHGLFLKESQSGNYTLELVEET